MAFRAAVVTFPGSNCDRDLAVALEKVSGTPALRVWHGDAELPARGDEVGQVSEVEVIRTEVMKGVDADDRVEVPGRERQIVRLGVQRHHEVLTAGRLDARPVLARRDPQVRRAHPHPEIPRQEHRGQRTAAAQVEHPHARFEAQIHY